MSRFVFDPPVVPTVPVVGDEGLAFPVRRIFCVGRNYAAHAREMGKDPDREPPFYFTKPADAIVGDGETVCYPTLTRDFHHEAELVLAIGREGLNIPVAQALDHVFGYAVGNDLTRRDLQLTARDKGRPWDWGKAFDRSAVCGPIHPVATVGHIGSGLIRLTVNGVERQSADIGDLIWSVPEIISFLSEAVRILPGDLVYTGTPAGVGPLVTGDECVVEIAGLGRIGTRIGEAVAA